MTTLWNNVSLILNRILSVFWERVSLIAGMEYGMEYGMEQGNGLWNGRSKLENAIS